MTDRECVLATIRGEVPDRLPWCPRLEFWYRVHKRNGTLPPGFESLDVFQIADKLGALRYGIVPDYTEYETEEDAIDCSLGFYNMPSFFCRKTLEGVERRGMQRGRETAPE